MRKAAVFVYGDIGRSPRMQNHAIELSKTHNQVYFMGYVESSPKNALIQNENIKIIDLQIKNLHYFRKISFYLYAMVRIILQILQILYLLTWKLRGLQFVLIQNPPCIPNLFAIWLASLIGRFKIVIDFHNYGYTILNLSIQNKIIIWIAKRYERYFAKKAHFSFCVSNTMKDDLKENWGIQAITLYDRPHFSKRKQKVDPNAFLKKYGLDPIKENELLLVSSTSWTKDEDFSILLDALQKYDKNKEGKKSIRTFITGKGPEKQKYMREMEERRQNWQKISVTAVWLQADDYPILLSICNLGVCLHCSSSGFDLPMKVVDMFGVGVPVLAIEYQALNQLVHNGVNGFMFKDSDDLHAKILQIANDQQLLKQIAKGATQESKLVWAKEWSNKCQVLYLK